MISDRKAILATSRTQIKRISLESNSGTISSNFRLQPQGLWQLPTIDFHMLLYSVFVAHARMTLTYVLLTGHYVYDSNYTLH